MNSSNRSFVSNLAFLLLLNLIVKPFWIFGIDRTVQNTVEAGEYGLYFGIFNFTYLFHILLDFGINNYNNRAIATDPGRVSHQVPQLALLKLLLSAAYVFICILGGIYLAYEGLQMRLLIFLVLNQILLSALLFVRSNVSGLQHFRWDSLLSISDKLIMIIICAALLWGNVLGEFRIEYFVFAQTIGYALALLLGLFVLKSLVGKLHWSWNSREMKQLLQDSLPYALIGLLMSIYFRIDGVMLKELLTDGPEQTAVYAAGYRILDAATIVALLFSTLLMPMFSRLLAEKKSIESLAKLGGSAVFVIAATSAVIGWFFRQPIMDMLYVDSTSAYGEVFGFLMIAYVFSSSVYVYGSLLVAGNKVMIQNGIAALCVLLNIGLNYLLIFDYGATGAAVATLATQILAGGLNYAYAVKIFSLQQSWSGLFRVSAYVLCLIAACFALHSSSLDWRLAVILLGLLSLLCAQLFGLLRVWQILALLRNRVDS